MSVVMTSEGMYMHACKEFTNMPPPAFNSRTIVTCDCDYACELLYGVHHTINQSINQSIIYCVFT